MSFMDFLSSLDEGAIVGRVILFLVVFFRLVCVFEQGF